MKRPPEHEPGCVCCAAGGDMEAVNAQIREVIRREGWAVIAVARVTGGYLGYTAGLSESGLHELYTEYDNPRLLAQALNEIALHQKQADAPWQPGQTLPLITGSWRVTQPTGFERTPMLRRLYGTTPPVWRMKLIA